MRNVKRMSNDTAILLGISLGNLAIDLEGGNPVDDCIAIEESDLWSGLGSDLGWNTKTNGETEPYQTIFRTMYETAKQGKDPSLSGIRQDTAKLLGIAFGSFVRDIEGIPVRDCVVMEESRLWEGFYSDLQWMDPDWFEPNWETDNLPSIYRTVWKWMYQTAGKDETGKQIYNPFPERI